MTNESPSNMTSLILTSCVNSTPASIAFASISVAPRGAFTILLKAAITTPYSSRITTPIPVFFLCLKTTPLKFTLYYSRVGGLHVITGLAPQASSCLTSFAAWYSSTRCNEVFKISLGLPYLPFFFRCDLSICPKKLK